MKILFVLHGFPPRDARGTELYAFYLLRELKTLGHEVHVFYPAVSPERPAYELESGRTDDIAWTTVNFGPPASGFLSVYEKPEITKLFTDFLKKLRPDVVHFHHLIRLSFSMVPAAARAGAAVLFTLHDFWLLCPRGQMLRRDLSVCGGPEPSRCAACQIKLFPLPRIYRAWAAALERFAVPHLRFSPLRACLRWTDNAFALLLGRRRPDLRQAVLERQRAFIRIADDVQLFISPSQTVRRKFIEAGFSPDKILHSSNGYPVERFSGFRRAPSGVLRFGLVGTFIPSKGIDLLIRAFNGLKNTDAVLNFFGEFSPYDGFHDYETYVRALAGHPKIHFRGNFEHEEVAACFSEIDILVVPSLWPENAPLTIQEAFLSGTPVIAARQGGMAEMIREGENGLLFNPGDIKDLRRQMARFLKEKELLDRLRNTLRTQKGERTKEVKSMKEDALFLTNLYKQLREDSRAGAGENIPLLARRDVNG